MSADHDDLTLDPLELAVQEQFLEEWRAGLRPRLSVYSRRYPAYAASLADLVAALPPDAQERETNETPAESFPQRLWTGEGVSRALHGIFGATPPRDERRLPRVAEEPGPYQTSQAPDAPPDAANDQLKRD